MYDQHHEDGTAFTLNADRVTFHRERAIWCFFKAWQYYLKGDDKVEMVILAFEMDMVEHLTKMFYEQQKKLRGGRS